MDLHYSQTNLRNAHIENCFTTLWIYTILKRCMGCKNRPLRFTTLWIYTILKHECLNRIMKKVSLPYGFTLFSNLK